MLPDQAVSDERRWLVEEMLMSYEINFVSDCQLYKWVVSAILLHMLAGTYTL